MRHQCQPHTTRGREGGGGDIGAYESLRQPWTWLSEKVDLLIHLDECASALLMIGHTHLFSLLYTHDRTFLFLFFDHQSRTVLLLYLFFLPHVQWILHPSRYLASWPLCSVSDAGYCASSLILFKISLASVNWIYGHRLLSNKFASSAFCCMQTLSGCS